MYAFRIILPISYLELNYAHADSADIADKKNDKLFRNIKFALKRTNKILL